ncbi:MAG: four-carbon acid sugar kinase family protein [Defluviimonas sp.]|uniref:3-oxo-tetronate kinase n=1 Tax=Albidovulum sp. TaxID=1872424 RepID=UPI001D9F4C7E|nr:four-carbon acid sugar kinase family protein [Paracoccaceae bacterium]MCC0063160.1 four-carbon acid sugar kinase family protein [Defluviimonas sp.]
MLLGAIGDDFTGSSDLGLILAKGGMRTVQYVGVPDSPAGQDVEAGIVALKTRSVPVAEAVARSLAALDWLRAQGCRQIYLKYCSTFDSTRAGNIGPVIEALIAALETRDPVIVCPAFPATGRTIYQGHLFVGDRLLSESGMRDHPLTPMTDPDIRRWLGHQVRVPVGHLPLAKVRSSARTGLLAERDAGRQIVVADTVEDGDLRRLGRAAKDFALLTGGSGLALALPEVHGASGGPADWRGEAGPALALSGSCSQATRGQVARHVADGGAARRIEIDAVMSGQLAVGELLDWALAADGLPLLYTSADPDEVRRTQARYGGAASAEAIEGIFARIAAEAVRRGVGRLISAGGETSGAVTQALGARALEIGPEIDPGVPALRLAGRPVTLALKSGNFGAEDFFAKAARVLEGT